MPLYGPPTPNAAQRRAMRERAYEDGRRRLLVSFSGGRSSAMIAHKYRHLAGASNVEFVFANTGQEDERTLDFVNECDVRWGLNLRWVESVVPPTLGVGTTYRKVDYDTAHRGPELFEGMCAKFGLPNRPFPHCTRELKTRPIGAYLRSRSEPSASADDPRRDAASSRRRLSSACGSAGRSRRSATRC